MQPGLQVAGHPSSAARSSEHRFVGSFAIQSQVRLATPFAVNDGSSVQKEGTRDGAPEGSREGSIESSREGSREGTPEGSREGSREGTPEGSREGSIESSREGSREGTPEGSEEGSKQSSLQVAGHPKNASLLFRPQRFCLVA
jgi:hypothetical protein